MKKLFCDAINDYWSASNYLQNLLNRGKKYA